MTLLELFDAYIETLREANFIEEQYPGGGLGIAINSDAKAIEWQALDKSARELRKQLRERLAVLVDLVSSEIETP
jgi:hypothetical protein